MLFNLLSQIFRDARTWVKVVIAQRNFERRHLKTLTAHGFDVKCPGCNRWINTYQTAIAIAETDMHLHYLCKCGHRSAWRLDTPFPIHDHTYQYDNKNPLFVDERA